MSALVVVAPGLASTVQDPGRPGLAHLGVAHAGWVDPRLAATMNRLVGNDDGAALIETCGELVVESDGPVLVTSSVEGVARSLVPGERVRVPAGHGRLWHYLAVRGGVAVAPVLGSRSTDTLSGLGPAPLRAGDRLVVGPDPGRVVVDATAPARALDPVARLTPGPRVDWFAPGSFAALAGPGWRVTASSRVGVRLTGVALERTCHDELPSEGLVRGAIQIPPDGDPVMMLADHPVTGGYPVIAVVDPDDVVVIAQTTPGGTVRFVPAR